MREHQLFWVLLFRQGSIYKEIGFNIGISIKPHESSILEKVRKDSLLSVFYTSA